MEKGPQVDFARLKAEVNEKNLQFFYDHRAVNGFYIYGGRKDPVRRRQLPRRVRQAAEDDRRPRSADLGGRQGKKIPTKIDDSDTGEFTKIETNFKNAVLPQRRRRNRRKKLKLPEGYEVNLFASEDGFPRSRKPGAVRVRRQGPAVGHHDAVATRSICPARPSTTRF